MMAAAALKSMALAVALMARPPEPNPAA